jgi:hypothetical protein
MKRAEHVARWKSVPNPLAAAIGRQHYNEKQLKRKKARQLALRSLVKQIGPALFLRRNWQTDLAKSFNVSTRTVYSDFQELFLRRKGLRVWR